MLNGISAGLVHGIATGDVSGNLGIAVRSHRYLRPDDIGQCTAGSGPQEGHGGIDSVGAPAQATQHCDCPGWVGWFAEDVVVQGYDSVTGDDDFAGAGGAASDPLEVGGVGLDSAQPGGQHGRRFIRQRGFGHVCQGHVEGQPK